MNRPYWITGGTALIAGEPQRDFAVLIEHDRIAAIGRQAQAQGAIRRLRADQWLLPGLIDVQVNGGGGLLFNEHPERLASILAAHQALGVAAILPTLITDAPALIPRAANAVLNSGSDAILGLHLEGPFISPQRPGIHNPAHIRKIGDADVACLTDLAARLAPRKLLITLAPEEVENHQLAALVAAGIILAIGHTMASFERCVEALALGVRGFTHLWNAMPGPTARAPGPVLAAFQQGFAGIIADFHHVAPANLRLTLDAKPATLFLVSDAMSPTGSPQQEFTLHGQQIRRAGGRLCNADGTLAGADLDLRRAVYNVADGLGVPFWRAWSMASEIPARFLGLADRGRIAEGCRAGLEVI